jgi:hypothetical protein
MPPSISATSCFDLHRSGLAARSAVAAVTVPVWPHLTQGDGSGMGKRQQHAHDGIGGTCHAVTAVTVRAVAVLPVRAAFCLPSW